MNNMKKKKLAKAITLAQITWCGALLSPLVSAAPGNVVSQTDGVTVAADTTDSEGITTTNINLATDLEEISWDEFNILNNEVVNFDFTTVDPENGIVINHVLSAGSTISGALNSNGHVVLINPRGVLFSQGASVDVGALTVSALGGTISGRDGSFALAFDDTAQTIDGDHYFSPGGIVNSGTILADRGVTLIGRSIQNLTLDASLGNARIESATIEMVAADSVSLSLDSQSGLYGVEVSSASLAEELIVNGSEALISGSKVLMTAAASDAITATAVNNSGTIRAEGIDLSGGIVRLTGSGGSVINTGTIEVSADATATQDVAAGSISIAGSEIAQSGTISASAVTDRSGGSVALTADDRLELGGTVSAAGSGSGNSGGTVITSVSSNTGQFQLNGAQSPVNTAGLNGATGGTWEIAADRFVVAEVSGDPGQDCGSGCISGDLLSDALDNNAAVTIAASGTENETGISIQDRINWSSGSSLILRSGTAVEVQDFINGNGQSELAGGDLAIDAESGFINDGSVTVSDFSLNLGQGGSDTSSRIGDLSYSGNLLVTGGSGFDRVSFADMDGTLAFSAQDSSTVSFSLGAQSGTLTDLETVVAEAGDTLSGTSGEDTFTLTGAGGVQSHGINFTGIGTLEGGDGDDTLIGESGVSWSLADLAQGRQGGIQLSGVEILQANNASLTAVSSGQQFAIAADSTVTVSGLSGFRFTDLTQVDVTGIANVSLDATALGASGLFLQDSAGLVSTTENLADGIGFSGFSSITVSALDATAIGSSAVYFRNVSGTSLSTISGGGTVFNGLSAVTAASLDSDGFAADLTLGATDGQVSSAAGAVQFSGVEAFRGSDGASVSGGNSWALGNGGAATESATGIRFDGAWGVTTAAGGNLTDSGSGNAFTLDAGNLSIANTNLVFSNLGAVNGVAGSRLDALSLGGEALYLTDTVGTVATAADGSGIEFSNFGEVSVSRLDTVTLAGGELFLRDSQGTSASAGASGGTLFSALESVDVNTLHTNGNSPHFDITGAGSIQVQSGGAVFNQLLRVTGGSGVEVSGGTDWALDLDGNASEAVSGVTFADAWTVNAASNAVLTGTGGNDTFTVNSDGDLAAGSNLTFAGLASVVAGTGDDTLAVSGVTLALDTNSAVTVQGIDLEFLGLSEVTGGGSSVLDALALGDTALYLADTQGAVSTVAVGAAGGIDFSGFGEVQVASIDATAIGASGLYFRNDSGTSLSTVAQGGVRFTSLDAVVSQVLHSNGFAADLTLGSVSGEVSSSAVEFAGVTSLVGSGSGAISGGSSWVLNAGGTATEGGSDIALEGMWSVSTASNAVLTDTGTGSEFTLANGDVSVLNSGLQFSNLGSVAGGTGSSLNALALNDAPLYLTDNAGSVATASDGSGIAFSNFSQISVAHLDAVTAAASALYLRNSDGTSASTGAASGTLFSNLEQVSVNRLFTNGQAASFNIAGAGSVQAQGGGATFTQLSEVTGGSGVEISGGGDWTLELAGGARESTSAILFADLWFVEATGGSLTGTTNTDVFDLNSSGELEVGALTFSGLASVSGGGSADTLDATGYADGVKLENGNDSVSTAGILFGEIGTIETTAVTGADTGTTFSLAGGSVTVDGSGLNFVGIESVDGGSANSFLDATSLGAAPLYLLNASDSRVSTVADGNGGISFTNFGGISVSQLDATAMGGAPLYLRDASGTQVSSARIGGTLISGLSGVQASRLDTNGNAATLSVTGVGSLATAGVTFSNVTEFSGGDTSTVSGGAGWSLRTGGGVEESTSGIAFSGDWIVDAAGLSLAGSDNDDIFVLNADGSVGAEQVTFLNLTSVLGGSGQDSLNALAYTDTLNLVGTPGALDTSTVVFREMEDVSAVSVTAATTGSDFTRAGDVIVADGLSFSGLTRVNGAAGVDSLSGANALFLRADSSGNYFADDRGVEFHSMDVFNAVNGSLTDEVGAADYVLLERNRISVAGADISGLSEVAAAGSGVLDASGYADGIWLTGASGEVVTASVGGLTFSGMESVTSATVTGSGGNESYAVLGNGSVNVLDMIIDGVSEVFAGGGTAQVTAASGQNWALVAGAGGATLANTASSSGIEFVDFTTLISQSADLLGTAGSEAFTLTGSEASGQLVGFGDMQFSGLGGVFGGGGADSLDATGYTSDVSLTTTDRELAAGDLGFFDFTSATMPALSSNDGNEHNFWATAAGTVTVSGMTISGLSRVFTDLSDKIESTDTVRFAAEGGFETWGIRFSEAGLVSGDLIEGDRFDDVVTISASGVISINGQALGYFRRVDTLEGNDTVIGLDGQDWTISGLNSASSQGVEFVNFEHLTVGNAGLIGSADVEVFTLQNDGRVRVGDILAEGMAYIDGGAGGVIDQLDAGNFDLGLQLTGTDGLLLAGGLEVRGFEAAISPLLVGSSAADAFTLGNNGLVAGGITFNGLSSVNGGGGSDRLDSDLDQDWILGSADTGFSHAGIDFASIETAAGGSGALQGGAADSAFTLGNGVLRVGTVDFQGVTRIDAGTGRDTVATEAGLTWSLDGANGSATVAGVNFLGIESVSTTGANIDTTTSGPQVFELSDSGAQVSVLDILFSSVSSVVASDGGGDTVVSAADQWQLQSSQNSITANGVQFSGIDSVEGDAAALIGTAETDEFRLASRDNSLVAAGISFSGVERISGAGGADTLVGTDGDDSFRVEDNGDIRAAAMQFSGLAGVDGGAGADVVDGAAASWTSATDASGLISGRALATVDSLTVVFESLERVENTGLYTGPTVVDDYHLTGPTSLTMGGIEFAGLQTLSAGSGSNTLYGVDANMTWRLGSDQGNVSDGQSSLAFTGFDAIIAGSGNDQFELGDASLTSLDTGAGDDVVQLQQAQLAQLSLGAGSDLLVATTVGQSLAVAAGSGDDRLQVDAAGERWSIDAGIGEVNSVGALDFSGFELLEDTGGGLDLTTGLAFDFYGSAEQGTAGIAFSGAGMTLAYDPSGALNLISRAASTIGGDLYARNADLTLAGDLDISSNVEVLSISSSAGDIDALVDVAGDLTIGRIDVGRGHLSLVSSGGGALTVQNAGELHVNAGSVVLGVTDQDWANIGTQQAPLIVDISETLDIVAFNFVHPIFYGQRPTVTSTGNGIQSLASAQASQGLRSAVQHPAEDIAQLDPGIFDEVTPYSLGIDTLNAPEMRLTANGLQSAEEDDEEDEDAGEEQEAGAAPAAGE